MAKNKICKVSRKRVSQNKWETEETVYIERENPTKPNQMRSGPPRVVYRRKRIVQEPNNPKSGSNDETKSISIKIQVEGDEIKTDNEIHQPEQTDKSDLTKNLKANSEESSPKEDEKKSEDDSEDLEKTIPEGKLEDEPERNISDEKELDPDLGIKDQIPEGPTEVQPANSDEKELDPDLGIKDQIPEGPTEVQPATSPSSIKDSGYGNEETDENGQNSEEKDSDLNSKSSVLDENRSINDNQKPNKEDQDGKIEEETDEGQTGIDNNRDSELVKEEPEPLEDEAGKLSKETSDQKTTDKSGGGLTKMWSYIFGRTEKSEAPEGTETSLNTDVFNEGLQKSGSKPSTPYTSCEEIEKSQPDLHNLKDPQETVEDTEDEKSPKRKILTKKRSDQRMSKRGESSSTGQDEEITKLKKLYGKKKSKISNSSLANHYAKSPSRRVKDVFDSSESATQYEEVDDDSHYKSDGSVKPKKKLPKKPRQQIPIKIKSSPAHPFLFHGNTVMIDCHKCDLVLGTKVTRQRLEYSKEAKAMASCLCISIVGAPFFWVPLFMDSKVEDYVCSQCYDEFYRQHENDYQT